MATEPNSGDVQAIASAISVIRPDEMALERWIGSLTSGAFRFGAGCLRSGDDAYDPLGVLAANQGVEWTWVDDEACWAADGDAYSIPPATFAAWLGVDEPDRIVTNHMKGHIDSFIDVVTRVADNASDFETVAKLLRQGIERSKQEKVRLRDLDIGHARIGYVGADHSADSFRRLGSFYR